MYIVHILPSYRDGVQYLRSIELKSLNVQETFSVFGRWRVHPRNQDKKLEAQMEIIVHYSNVI